MCKIAIIDSCAKCPHKEMATNTEYFEFVCSMLDQIIPDKEIQNILKDCPLPELYQEQEQEYMDRVKK